MIHHTVSTAPQVSTFEFVGSGAAAALVRWLTAEPEGGKEEEPHAATVTRLATLWDALQETGASGALVRKLQVGVRTSVFASTCMCIACPAFPLRPVRRQLLATSTCAPYSHPL